MKLTIVILAAGMGKRMQSDLPKVLHKLAGKPMLAHAIDSAKQLNPAQIVVVVGHGADIVQAAFEQQKDLAFALQQPQHGTGHAVQQAEPLFVGNNQEDKTLILYGDVPLVQAATLERLIESSANGVAVLTEFLDDPTGYGRIVRDEKGNVNRIVEHKDASADEHKINEVNTGILCAPTSLLKNWLAKIDNNNAQGEYYLTDVIALAVNDGVTVSAAHPDASWETLGVNSRLQQVELERAWQQEQARQLLTQGVALADDKRIDIRGTLTCGRDVFIDIGCIFEGDVVLEDGVQVGPHCVLKNVKIAKNSTVEAFSHLEQASVADQCKVGPYARLRPGAQLAKGSQVGNFVEIKNTQLGAFSKASHLSYLGDAVIGQRVNIGAGTITCNYDGVNKFTTTIGDDAFIGSDTQLIAPVTVGEGATIGAGTSLRQDAPANQLTVTQTSQTTFSNWQRPTKKKH
ncbi:MAG: bifunctional UDP-N-acetylglucosamine diphosphorylase/glucosamine-1-phosphate N-acetyltransferase GlmU [Alcaligenaceae bacterium]|nr:bifunctional UDP-N-acetylglucosamine diphosphorylase/glucosamine-1-phosphate N-acetyltransferase GlmU [Alcaligenaceae bacterium]